MTIKGIKRRISFFLINNIFSGTNPKTFNIKRKLLIWSGIKVGENTKIVGPIRIYGELEIGNDTWIGTNFTVHGNGKVVIGEKCDIAPDVTFITGSHDIGNKERRAGTGKNENIIIGKGTWICAQANIIGGVHIEESCVIAAGSLINRDVYKNTLVGGVPAKKIKALK